MTTAVDESVPAAVSSSPDSTLGVEFSSTSEPPISSSHSRGEILLVDDEPALVRGLSRMLTARGYQVTSAHNGRAALGSFHQGAYDVIVSDIAMPDMNGIELLQQVREHDTQLPVVLMTGEPSVGTAVKALEHGAFHYLTKPISFDDLESVVDRAAALRRMARMQYEAAELLDRPVASQHRAPLENSFFKALDSLWMAYQPIVRASDGSVYGYEALLRSKEATLPHPGAVLDAAERLGLVDLLGRAIRAKAAAPLANAPAATALFVNLHTTDLLDATLMSPDAPLSKIAHRVVLEITERASLEKVKDVRARVAALREMGFRIAVDDLGAGYAGLTSFALLEPEIVKLDMSLIRDVHLNATKQKLVRSMTQLSQDMGMLVVGEGVETLEERTCLIDLGCDLLQGYLVARPDQPFPLVNW